ncbi:MAG: hypothetical protein KAY62_03270, partial [Burkholderiaceae bacterium]|nr:hypothetical protein [Burkholderiaceae bacterium]
MNASIDPRISSWLDRLPDTDAAETKEWQEAFRAVLEQAGPERAKFILDELVRTAHTSKLGWHPDLNSP